MATLPTNYVDDVLDESMGGKRHYNMTTDAHGTYFTDVSEYDQRGTTFGAAQVNEITTQVNANTSSVADKLDKTGDSKDNTVTFTSSDVSSDSSATSWTTVSKLTSASTFSTMFNQISKMFKNIRYLNNNLPVITFYSTKPAGITLVNTDYFNVSFQAAYIYGPFKYIAFSIALKNSLTYQAVRGATIANITGDFAQRDSNTRGLCCLGLLLYVNGSLSPEYCVEGRGAVASGAVNFSLSNISQDREITNLINYQVNYLYV